MRPPPVRDWNVGVSNGRAERRLTAILAADVVGYARLLRADEAGTLAAVKAAIEGKLAPNVEAAGGRIIKTLGDGALAVFPSALDALTCAVAFQRAMAEQSDSIQFRVGVNAGDAVLENGDVFGDAVNVAARLEAAASPGGICISARVRDDARGRSGLVFEDLGERKLKNIDDPVRIYRVQLGDAPAPAMSLPDRPSIAVLPFENMSGDPGEEYFADAVTDDIIHALSRWRWFFVIARNSSFAYKGRPADVVGVARALGVRYVLEGSVRKAGQRVRVVAQLIDGADARHIWSDTFERDMTDLFALQDEITEHVVNAIEPAMLESEGARAARRNVGDLSAFDCFQRGMWRLHQLSRDAFEDAERLFKETINRDPRLALGYTGLARILYGRVAYGWSKDPQHDLNAADAAARAAIALDPRDAWAHFALSGALLYLGRHDEALREAERTLTLNPNFAFGHFRLGQVLIYCGRATEAVTPLERSIRLSPFDPQMGAMIGTLALAHFHAGAYDLAADRAREAIRQNEARGPLVLAASLARLGRHEEARALIDDPIRTRAQKLIARSRPLYAHAAELQDFLDALRLAGFDDLPDALPFERARANSAIASESG